MFSTTPDPKPLTVAGGGAAPGRARGVSLRLRERLVKGVQARGFRGDLARRECGRSGDAALDRPVDLLFAGPDALPDGQHTVGDAPKDWDLRHSTYLREW